MNWTSVEDEMPPMTPYGQDGSTERVLVWVKKDYYPYVYAGSADYSEDGVFWYVDGLDHRPSSTWKVTHWAPEPKGPENGQSDHGTDHKGDAVWPYSGQR